MTNDFLKQDIFFFVTTIAVIILTLLVSILIIYFIKISRDVKYLLTKARTGADIIADDMSDLRDNIKAEGFKLKYLFRFLSRLKKKR